MDKEKLVRLVKQYVFQVQVQSATAPLAVVGYPRTGFTLMLSIIAQIKASQNARISNPWREKTHGIFFQYIEGVNAALTSLIVQRGLANDLVYNRNFHTPLGGPNWIDREDNSLCVRKYLGIKGLGDMTVIIKLPRQLINWHDIPHSHGPLKPLLERDTPELLIHTVRSPSGTINSACHSINAIASEYIQRWIPDLSIQEETKLREDLAMSKLSDLNFFSALAEPMKASFEDLLLNRSSVSLYRWEDIITDANSIIKMVGVELGYQISDKISKQIWKNLSGKNLTEAHKHNYRPNTDDIFWHNRTLTNEHIDLLMEMDFQRLANELNVAPPTYLNKEDYNDFQLKAAKAIKKGRPIDAVEDRELYWFAFQKTNIDFTKFKFKIFDWKKYTKIERTNISDDTLIADIWDIFETECKKLNEKILQSI